MSTWFSRDQPKRAETERKVVIYDFARPID